MQTAIMQYPNWGPYHRFAGGLFLCLGNLPAAAQELGLALRLNPADAAAQGMMNTVQAFMPVAPIPVEPMATGYVPPGAYQGVPIQPIATGAMPSYGTGPMPSYGTGPMPSYGTGAPNTQATTGGKGWDLERVLGITKQLLDIAQGVNGLMGGAPHQAGGWPQPGFGWPPGGSNW